MNMDINAGLGFVMLVVNLMVLYKMEKGWKKREDRYVAEQYKIWVQYIKAFRNIEKELYGKLDSFQVKVKLAEKLADRAFSLASSANLGLVALSRTLAVRPVYASKKQMVKNELAQKQTEEAIFGVKKPEEVDYSQVDWMYAALDDEEREIVDSARQLAEARKESSNS
jgi:hypothetical protein